MTNEIDKRRALAMCLYPHNLCEEPCADCLIRTVRAHQSDEAAGIGYYDTRTHVVVPRELLERWRKTFNRDVRVTHVAQIEDILTASQEDKE